MSNISDLAELINKLGSLDKDQLEKLLSSVDKEAPKKRGRPKKSQVTENPVRRNGTIATGPRINEFDTMDLKNKRKEDIKIDKLLNKNKPKVREKNVRDNGLVKASCRKCGKEGEERADLTWIDFETKERVYNCNRCSNTRREG